MKRPILRPLGLGFMAAIAGGTLAAVAADMLHLSSIIAGSAAGVALAVIVVALDHRHHQRPPR